MSFSIYKINLSVDFLKIFRKIHENHFFRYIILKYCLQNQLLAETPNIKRLPMCLVDIKLHLFIDRYNFLGRRQFSASIWRIRDFMQGKLQKSMIN